MAEPVLRVTDEDFGTISAYNTERPFTVETWDEFVDKASDEVPCLVDRIWPEDSFGFIASPPKKGKTWLAIALGLSVSTGSRFLNRYDVPNPQPVIYIALEGHRAALRARVAALARGMGLDPFKGSGDLDAIHFIYKPRGINIATQTWADHIGAAALNYDARLVIVDVLRAAATIKENAQEEFSALRQNLSPITDTGTSIALLHHFTKTSETSKERSPAERMSGSGAMYGAMDVGIFITGSDDGARKLRIEFDMRDIATPPPIGTRLEGKGRGPNGGLTHHDRAWWTSEEAPAEDDVSAPAEEILEWLEQHDGDAPEDEIALAFDVSTKTIFRRRIRLEELGVEFVSKRGTKTRYRIKQRTTDTTDMSDTPPVSDQLGLNTGIDEDNGHNGQMDVSDTENAPNAGETSIGHNGLPTGEDTPCPLSPPGEPKIDDDPLPF